MSTDNFNNIREREAYGAALKVARENLGMTKAELARILRIRWNTIHKIEIGDLQAGRQLLEKIKETTGLNGQCSGCGRFWFPTA